MPMFLDPNARVPVSDGRNTVYIRAKMDMATRDAVMNEIREVRKSDKASKTNDEGGELRGYGAYHLALLHHNVLAWDGPDFAGVPCTRANIDRADPTEPIWELVADEIGKRNERAESPDPNSLAPSGSTDGIERR